MMAAIFYFFPVLVLRYSPNVLGKFGNFSIIPLALWPWYGYAHCASSLLGLQKDSGLKIGHLPELE